MLCNKPEDAGVVLYTAKVDTARIDIPNAVAAVAIDDGDGNKRIRAVGQYSDAHPVSIHTRAKRVTLYENGVRA